jgi:hypothetical protein
MATEANPKPVRLSWMVGVCVFLLIAAFFLFTEHRAHIAGSLPYLLLLACPLIHLLMHRGHGHGGGHAHHDQAHGGER